MRAGRLRHSIEIQSPTGDQNTVGERVTNWSTVDTVRADIEPISVAEQLAAAQRQDSTSHKIRIRWHSSLAAMDASWRVKYGTRIFTIDGPPMNIRERNREVVLMCTEGLRTE